MALSYEISWVSSLEFQSSNVMVRLHCPLVRARGRKNLQGSSYRLESVVGVRCCEKKPRRRARGRDVSNLMDTRSCGMQRPSTLKRLKSRPTSGFSAIPTSQQPRQRCVFKVWLCVRFLPVLGSCCQHRFLDPLHKTQGRKNACSRIVQSCSFAQQSAARPSVAHVEAEPIHGTDQLSTDEQLADAQQKQVFREAVDLETLLKERDACGVSTEATFQHPLGHLFYYTIA